jgi:DNA-binding NtrC family response regulator
MNSNPSRAGEPLLIGSSVMMTRVREQLRSLAQVPWPVRIEGPTGSGKGVAARFLHEASVRRDNPFVCCNLNLLADGLEIAELVGSSRGAFTGAVADRPGVFEQAHGGTVFLDELATASSRVQRALLQLIEDGTVQRLGEQRARTVDTRIVSATNVDLEAALLRREFRNDLYYRLGALIVRMPALSEHPEDIPDLADVILRRKCGEVGKPFCMPSTAELDHLCSYAWPGNVRELLHVMEYFIVYATLPQLLSSAVVTCETLAEVVRRHGGNKSAAARELGMSRTTLYERLRQSA